ncbi:MAG TPA: hypothetical protein VHC19_08340, partial [Pirellulales bacterium]|nr:hypothetical protein [Pirellulales bacterium]
VQQTTDQFISLYKLTAEIESIRARTGRLPKDERELIALRGQPISTNGESAVLSYKRLDEDHYRLDCVLQNFWGRQRDTIGWIVRYYGPKTPRRVRVVLF